MHASGSQRALAMCDGGLASLVSLMLIEHREAITVWIPPRGTPCFDNLDALIGPEHAAAAREQAELLGISSIPLNEAAPWPGAAPMQGSGTFPAAALLLMAVEEARRLGIEIVVWPVIAGDDLEMLFALEETARLVSRLASLGQCGAANGPRPADSCEIRTPVADLSAEQLVDLALDLDSPLETCWWAGAGDQYRSISEYWRRQVTTAADRLKLDQHHIWSAASKLS